MIYTMILLSIFSIILFIKNFTSRYTWIFLIMVLGLNISIFSLIIFIAKNSNYVKLGMDFFSYDYTFFIYLSRLRINYYDITRMYNMGIITFIFSMPMFIFDYSRNIMNKTTTKTIFGVSVLLIPVMFYLWFYDPETSFMLYVMANKGNKLLNVFDVQSILNIVRIVNYIWLFTYIVFPFYFLYKNYSKTTISLKKRQIIALSLCLFILDLIFIFLYILGSLGKSNINDSGQGLLRFTDAIDDNVISLLKNSPVAILLVIIIMLMVLTKFKSLETTDILKKYIINKNTRNLNQNLKGVFHSFKNTLFSIKIISEQLKNEYRTDEGYEKIERLEQVTNNSLKSVTRILDTFQEVRIQPAKRNIAESLDTAIEKIITDDIKLYKNFDEEVFVYFDFYHLTEVFTNLFQNSIEAIKSVKDREGILKIDLTTEHEWAVIRVYDNGCGISKVNMKKIFEPLFSTKSRHNNWGMGLPYVYRVIKAHLGFINVDSIEGEYTCFEVLIPRLKGVHKNGKN